MGNSLTEEKIVNLNDFKKERLRMESTDLCRVTLDRAIYMYNNEIYPKPILLKLLRNAAGLLEKKIKIDRINKSPDLSEDTAKELNIYENQISHLAKEINKVLNKLAECRSTQE